MGVTAEDTRGGAGRWLVGLLLLGLTAFSGYVGYQKWGDKPAAASAVGSATPQHDARLQQLLKTGHQQLHDGQLDAAMEQFQKASGVAENDPQVHEALCSVQVARAEGSFLRMRLGLAPLKQLEQHAERAYRAIASARKLAPPVGSLNRLSALEQQLNTWLSLAYVDSGNRAKAQGAFQARLGAHPHADLLRQLIDRGPRSTPSSEASAATSASSVAEDEVAPATSVAASTPPVRRREKHYEFDHEPEVGSLAGPNELKLPSQPKPPPPAATQPDTTDLP